MGNSFATSCDPVQNLPLIVGVSSWYGFIISRSKKGETDEGADTNLCGPYHGSLRNYSIAADTTPEQIRSQIKHLADSYNAGDVQAALKMTKLVLGVTQVHAFQES